MIERIIKILLFIVFLNYANNLSADSLRIEKYKQFSMNFRAGVNFNYYQSNFSDFPGVINCGIFKNGSGFSYSLEASIEKDIFNRLSLGLGASIRNRTGSFLTPSTLPIRDIDLTDLSIIELENNLLTEISFLEINPELKFNFISLNSYLNFRFGTGFIIGIPLISSFEQKEIIKSPDYVNFISTGTKERIISEGEITNIKPVHYGLTTNLENIIEISESISLTQQLSFDYYFNDIIENIDWNLFGIRFDLGLKFGFLGTNTTVIEEIPLQEKIVAEVIVKQDTILQPQLNIEYVDQQSQYSIQTGFELLASLPTVNSVFFETNSSEISNYYILHDTLLPSFFYGDAIEARKYLFLRIVDLFKNNPSAKIHLIGATSGQNNEPDGLLLARKRTGAVKNILISLGVPASIISSSESIFPLYPSNQDYPEGILENQRVDIYLKNASLQEYVGLKNFTELTGTAVFNVEFDNVKENNFILTNNISDSVINLNKSGKYDVYFTLRDSSDKVSILAKVTNSVLSDSCQTDIEIDRLLHKPVEVNYNKFKAILMFDYGSAELSLENKELLSQLINQLTDNVKIIIKGSADALGTEAKNIQLSEQRAIATKDFINKITNNKFKIIIDKNFLKFNETSPEGRFFNRAISIEIEKQL